ncbi:MAG TPA: hypothetical protein VN659_00625 [Pyrinomonadaceae bacterium]|jgi:hypothetical protein|nr:hypothetical protein [Pyrinomonadaceae bacterium]
MNTQLNNKMRQLLVSPTFLTLLLGVVVMLALSGPTIQAQTTQTTTTAVDAPVDSSVTIAAKGSVSDPNGSITVTGNVGVTCRRVIDTTSATSPSLVLLDLDLSGLQGTSGSTKTTLKTYVTGGNHAEEIRPLQASDTIIVSSPYYDSTKGPLTARTMLITATLNFDVSTGKVTGGTITIGDNVVTKAAVGSFTTTGATPQ